jgi:hypothetical protein
MRVAERRSRVSTSHSRGGNEATWFRARAICRGARHAIRAVCPRASELHRFAAQVARALLVARVTCPVIGLEREKVGG